MTQVGSRDLVVPMPRQAQELAAAAIPTAITPVGASPARRLLHRWYLPMEAAVATLLAVVVAVLVDASAVFSAAVIALALVVNYHAGRETVRPGLPHAGRIIKDQGVPISVTAAGVALGVVPTRVLTDAIVLVSVVAGVAVVGALVRRALAGQARLVMVGNRADVAKAATRWAGDRRIKVVGALILDDSPVVDDWESFGVRTISGLGEVATWVSTWQADLAVVVPGEGITSELVRRLAWDLENTQASFAVMGVLDTVAPHRIDAARFADATLLHVRSSRPSTFVRGVKATLSWLAALVLLLLALPLIGLMAIAVRLESEGPAIFRQVRVGKDGKPFTMYKMRSMVADAEQVRERLMALDEGNGVLFKIHDDPRVTRLGRFLRRSSIDELPQLINVLKGDMSLVGPRPALPEEVAHYDEVALRRLAVRPGLTGLWQVSGRSTLSWERSLELDLDYADNWRLTDDVLIGLRTVDAVARRKGAY